MSNEYKDWVADRKQDSIDEKFKRLLGYLKDNFEENGDHSLYLLMSELTIEIQEDIKKMQNNK